MHGLTRLLGLQGSLVLDDVESAALRGNALGDPARRLLPVYLPPGYDPEGSRRYPVFYLLHAFSGDAGSQVGVRPWEHNAVQRLDRLIASGTVAPAILAIVDGFTRLGGSQFVDSVHNGAYATYVVRDVVAHIDGRYRTLAREGGRAVLGHSSGGFGAIHLALAHPGVFAAFASHAGDAYFRYAYLPAFPAARRALAAFADPAAFVADFERAAKRPAAAFDALSTLAYAAAYSPLAAEPFAFDLPFARETGELRADVVARWLAFDPVERVGAGRTALAQLRLRYLDCGRRDEYGLDAGARILAQRLRDHGLVVQHEEFDDGHRGTGYRFDVSLAALAAVLDRR